MEKHLEIYWWNGVRVGHLIHRGPIYFIYDEDWIKSGHNLSPLLLPFNDIAFNGDKGVNKLPGLIADCLPDSWGIKLARRLFAQNKWGEPTTMGLLAWRGVNGLGALQFRPFKQAKQKHPILESIHAESLARGAMEIERNEPTEVLPQLAKGGTAGGAYPKSIVLFYEDGTLKVGAPDGVGIPSLLKFDLSAQNQNSRLEHAYSLMARSAGIRSVKTSLLEENRASDRYHLLVERFDVPDFKDSARRIHFHSLASILHRPAHGLDYRDLFRTIIQLQCDPEEIQEALRRMIFNVLSSNHDDHGKNHAFVYDENQKRWALSPAFDVTPSHVILERGMTICDEVWPSMKVMRNLAAEAGVKGSEFDAIFQRIENSISLWNDFADQSKISGSQVKEINQRLLHIRQRVVLLQ